MARSADLIPVLDSTRKTSPWLLSIPPKLSETGKRQRRFFTTKALAEGEAQAIKIRKANYGMAARLMSPSDEQQAAAAIRLLKDEGLKVQLAEVVGDYIERHRQRVASVTLDHCWNAYIQRPDHKSDAHKKNLERTLKRFEDIKTKMVSEIRSSDIEKCLSGASASYRNAMLREVRAVLNYGMSGSRKWLASNPVSECEFIERKLGEVSIYAPKQIEDLLKATVALHPELVPAVAIMAFGGVRPDHNDGEITRLDWNHIVLKDREKRIEMPHTITKTAKDRTIKARPTLVSWLEWHRAQKGSTQGLVCPFKGERLRVALREIFTKAAVARIQDGLRSSFASYLAKKEDLDTAEQELGHVGGRELMNRHYRRDVRLTVANKFWAIRAPKKVRDSKIISISEAA